MNDLKTDFDSTKLEAIFEQGIIIFKYSLYTIINLLYNWLNFTNFW